MAEMMTTDVRAIMDRTPFDVAAVADLRELLNRDPSRYRTLREAVQKSGNVRKKRKKARPIPISGWVWGRCCWVGISLALSN